MKRKLAAALAAGVMVAAGAGAASAAVASSGSAYLGSGTIPCYEWISGGKHISLDPVSTTIQEKRTCIVKTYMPYPASLGETIIRISYPGVASVSYMVK